MRTLCDDLAFPEGPVVLSDGSIAVCEVEAGQVRQVFLDGTSRVLARTGGGPNGLALGPDGALYVANNGGMHPDAPGMPAVDYSGGSIQRIDLGSAVVTTLYSHCGEHRLSAPNDLVFDTAGGLWFTDSGKRFERHRDHGALFYARIDGSFIDRVVHPVMAPNGVALSPDGRTLYLTETDTSRLIGFEITAPGQVRCDPFPAPAGGRLLWNPPGNQMFDSIAVQADGCICVTALIRGEIDVVTPDGALVATHAMSDPYPTNLCFGGDDMKTAYVTLVGSGRLLEIAWPQPGLRLNW